MRRKARSLSRITHQLIDALESLDLALSATSRPEYKKFNLTVVQADLKTSIHTIRKAERELIELVIGKDPA